MNFCTLSTVINGRELKYDIETKLIWCVHGKTKKWAVRKISRQGDGYLCMTIGSKTYQHHRIIYKFYNPNWNIEDGSTNNSIDHINGTKTDNCIANLRNVTNQKNQWNRTKAKGYTWNKARKKWKAQIKLNNKLFHLGLYDLEEDARNAYLEAKKVLHIITPI